MAVVGFDYWQVLSHYSEQLAEIIDAYRRAGIEVVVISAVGSVHHGTVEGSVRELGWDLPVHEVLYADAREAPALKLAKCRELGVTAFYDDRADVCRHLADHGIVAFQVMRRDGADGDGSASSAVGSGSEHADLAAERDR